MPEVPIEFINFSQLVDATSTIYHSEPHPFRIDGRDVNQFPLLLYRDMGPNELFQFFPGTLQNMDIQDSMISRPKSKSRKKNGFREALKHNSIALIRALQVLKYLNLDHLLPQANFPKIIQSISTTSKTLCDLSLENIMKRVCKYFQTKHDLHLKSALKKQTIWSFVLDQAPMLKDQFILPTEGHVFESLNHVECSNISIDPQDQVFGKMFLVALEHVEIPASWRLKLFHEEFIFQLVAIIDLEGQLVMVKKISDQFYFTEYGKSSSEIAYRLPVFETFGFSRLTGPPAIALYSNMLDNQ